MSQSSISPHDPPSYRILLPDEYLLLYKNLQLKREQSITTHEADIAPLPLIDHAPTIMGRATIPLCAHTGKSLPSFPPSPLELYKLWTEVD